MSWKRVAKIVSMSENKTASSKGRRFFGLVLGVFFLGIFVGLNAFFFVVPKWVDQNANAVYDLTGVQSLASEYKNSLPPPSDQAELMHSSMVFADMHADTLLWDRDLTVRSSWGHLDFERMREGRLSLATMGIVTKSPRGLNLNSNKGDTDNITLLAIAERWDPATFTSLKSRVYYQSEKLKQYIQADGKSLLITSSEQLGDFFSETQRDSEFLGFLLAIEGAHALEGDLGQIVKMKEAGVRIISPSHLFDSEIAGSSTGEFKEGLTELGKKWVKNMNDERMIIDLSHASEKTIEDVINLSQRPVMVSHTGFKSVCNHNRNLSDNQAKAIAKAGGLIGVGIWNEVLCGKTLAHVGKAFRYAANLVGVEHIALGSDFDGFVGIPLDASGMVYLVDELLRQNFTGDEIEKILFQNYFEFLKVNLPQAAISDSQ